MTQESIYSLLGKKVSFFRQQKKFTQQALASAIELNRTSISNIEQGRQKILLHCLFEIAYALDIDPSELLPQKNELENLIGKANKDRYSIPKNISQDEKLWLTKLIADNANEH